MADSLTIETWTEFGVGMAFLLVRLYARVDILGFRRLQMDDFFAVMAMVSTCSGPSSSKMSGLSVVFCGRSFGQCRPLLSIILVIDLHPATICSFLARTYS
jgi:hypothetical protein